MITNIGKEVVESIIKDDPVRPHLTTDFRTSSNREVYALYEDKYAEQHFPSDDIKAIICVAYTNEVPKNEYELEMFSQAACQDGQRGHIAVFYTVWSYAKGAGRQVVFDVTTMAERFHLRNGAELISKHDSCQNFEYTL